MERRHILTSLGVGLKIGVAGCLQQDSTNGHQSDEEQEVRKKACVEISSENTLDYQFYKFNSQKGIIKGKVGDSERSREDRDFVVINSRDKLEKLVNLGNLNEDGRDDKEAYDFVDNTDFSNQALLIWHKRLASGETFEVLGVKHENGNIVHVHTCSYRKDDLALQSDKYYYMFIRSDVNGIVERAKWTHNEIGSSESYEWGEEQGMGI